MITDLQKPGTWKIQSTIEISFIFSKDSNEEQLIHSKSDNINVMTYNNANEIIEEIFELILSKY